MSFKAGLVQLCSGTDMGRNLAAASALVREAQASGAHYVLTPEVTNLVEDDKERTRAIVKPEAEDLSVAGFSALAAELGLWLHIGSLALRADDGRAVNRSLLFAPDGKVAARYDKIHLFDVTLPSGQEIRESQSFAPGDQRDCCQPAMVQVRVFPFATTCGFRSSTTHWPKPVLLSWRCLRPSPFLRAGRTGMCCSGRGPSRREVSCWQQRRAARMNAGAPPMVIR